MKYLQLLAKILLSILLLWLSVICFKHTSSAGFEFGFFLALMAIVHPVFWPSVKEG